MTTFGLKTYFQQQPSAQAHMSASFSMLLQLQYMHRIGALNFKYANLQVLRMAAILCSKHSRHGPTHLQCQQQNIRLAQYKWNVLITSELWLAWLEHFGYVTDGKLSKQLLLCPVEAKKRHGDSRKNWREL